MSDTLLIGLLSAGLLISIGYGYYLDRKITKLEKENAVLKKELELKK